MAAHVGNCDWHTQILGVSIKGCMYIWLDHCENNIPNEPPRKQTYVYHSPFTYWFVWNIHTPVYTHTHTYILRKIELCLWKISNQLIPAWLTMAYSFVFHHHYSLNQYQRRMHYWKQITFETDSYLQLDNGMAEICSRSIYHNWQSILWQLINCHCLRAQHSCQFELISVPITRASFA